MNVTDLTRAHNALPPPPIIISTTPGAPSLKVSGDDAIRLVHFLESNARTVLDELNICIPVTGV